MRKVIKIIIDIVSFIAKYIWIIIAYILHDSHGIYDFLGIKWLLQQIFHFSLKIIGYLTVCCIKYILTMEIMKITVYGRTYCCVGPTYISKEIIYSVTNNELTSFFSLVMDVKMIDITNLKTNKTVTVVGESINIDNNFYKTEIDNNFNMNNSVYYYITNTVLGYFMQQII